MLSAARTKLIAANTAAGSRVYIGRLVQGIDRSELPLIVLHSPQSTSEPLARPITRCRASINLVVVCFAAPSSSDAATAEGTAELAAHALEQSALAALMAHPQSWDSGIETITGLDSRSVDTEGAEYIFRARAATLNIRKIAEYTEASAAVAGEVIRHEYTYAEGDVVTAETVIEE